MPDLNADRRETNELRTAERNGGVRRRPTPIRKPPAVSLRAKDSAIHSLPRLQTRANRSNPRFEAYHVETASRPQHSA
jgi:hypothetical protein